MRSEYLPNLATVGNLTAGVLALAAAYRGHPALAAYLVLTAVVLDGVDGKLARFLHTASAFGRELDSLADLVSFCVAPALLFYADGLASLRAAGLAAVIAVVLAGAVRLARFNVGGPIDHFQGLPTTAAGAIAAGAWLVPEWLGVSLPPPVVATLLFALAAAMVSRIRVPKI